VLLVRLHIIHGKSSVPREEPKGPSWLLPPFLLVMVIWAVHFATPTLSLIPAFVNAEIVRMVFLFFPAMAVAAPILQPAPIIIREQVLFCVPVLALLFRIVELERFSPEILPIMRVHTDFAFVVFVGEGAPDCLKVEHVEVGVALQVVQHVYRELCLRMCESTHISVVAGIEFLGELLAEFSLVLFRMVEVFDAVVGARAVITPRAGPRISLRTHFGGVGT